MRIDRNDLLKIVVDLGEIINQLSKLQTRLLTLEEPTQKKEED